MGFSVELICTGRGIVKRYRQMLVDIADECDLTAAELNVLLFLENDSRDTAREIAESRHMSKASVSKAVDSLYDKRYISGHSDPADRRIVHLMIEDGARDVLRIACIRQKELMECLFSGLSEDEISFLESIAHKINHNLCSKERNL
ncbi:MAG: winged helix-turn-helix transcriptional regulator [Firmicutes bacterium]|nr:winged helix-turn-helix transcriptional regulator [Bacillota bacterium]